MEQPLALQINLLRPKRSIADYIRSRMTQDFTHIGLPAALSTLGLAAVPAVVIAKIAGVVVAEYMRRKSLRQGDEDLSTGEQEEEQAQKEEERLRKAGAQRACWGALELAAALLGRRHHIGPVTGRQAAFLPAWFGVVAHAQLAVKVAHDIRELFRKGLRAPRAPICVGVSFSPSWDPPGICWGITIGIGDSELPLPPPRPTIIHFVPASTCLQLAMALLAQAASTVTDQYEGMWDKQLRFNVAKQGPLGFQAFTTQPGCGVVITEEMLGLLSGPGSHKLLINKDETQVVTTETLFVLGHEVAHLVCSHTQQQAYCGAVASACEDLVLGTSDACDWLGLGRRWRRGSDVAAAAAAGLLCAGRLRSQFRRSKQYEKDADLVGALLGGLVVLQAQNKPATVVQLLSIGAPPGVSALRLLRSVEPKSPAEALDWCTHPRTEDRIVHLEELAALAHATSSAQALL